MSLYELIVVTDSGITKIIVVGNFPHIHDARKAINEWVFSTYNHAIATINFMAHETTIDLVAAVADGVDLVKVLE